MPGQLPLFSALPAEPEPAEPDSFAREWNLGDEAA